jgi:hypothetical protein
MGVIKRHVGTATGKPPLFDVEVVCCHEIKSSCIVGGQKTPETIGSDHKPSRSFIGLVRKNLRKNLPDRLNPSRKMMHNGRRPK